MLEPHSPHQAVHTWKDAFIHIGIITVGLLIAIGLEQTVEAIHHARERHELIEDMRVEAEQNIPVLHGDIDGDVAQINYDLALIAALRSARQHDDVVTVVVPSGTIPLSSNYPARAIWTAAKTNGKVALLTDRQSAMYERLDHIAELATESKDRFWIAQTKVQADNLSLGIHLNPGATIDIPAPSLPSLISDLAQLEAAARASAGFHVNWLAACDTVATGVQDREDYVQYRIKESNALTNRLPQP